MVLAERLVLVCHQSFVCFDPSFVSQIGQFEVCLLLIKKLVGLLEVRLSVSSFPPWISHL